MLLEGIRSVNSIWCLIKEVFPRSRLLLANRCSHLNSSSMAHTSPASGHSSRPWRFNASRIHNFLESWADPPEASVGRTTGGI